MLKPLIEELKLLWQGVEAYDYDQKQKFNLRVMYLWSVHDFKAYNIFSGWSCNGLLTCPICMKETSYFRLKFVGKNGYVDCHRCFLPLDHKFRLDSDTFKMSYVLYISYYVFDEYSLVLVLNRMLKRLKSATKKLIGRKSSTALPTDTLF
jgi:hypothetical protein